MVHTLQTGRCHGYQIIEIKKLVKMLNYISLSYSVDYVKLVQSAKRVHLAKDLWRLILKKKSSEQDLGDYFLINSCAYMYLLNIGDDFDNLSHFLETDLEISETKWS